MLPVFAFLGVFLVKVGTSCIVVVEPFTMHHDLRWLPGIGLEGGSGRQCSIFRGWPRWGSPFEFFVSIAYQKKDGKR